MNLFSKGEKLRLFRPLTHRQWVAGTGMFLIFLAIMLVSDLQVRNPILFFPASGVALAILFLEGIELWPFVFAASFLGNALGGFPLPFILLAPVAQSLQAVIGAAIMRNTKLDPLFRRSRDIFILFCVVAVMALIVPSFTSIARTLNTALTGTVFPLTTWYYRYTSALFGLIIMTPFVLRWLAKPRFSRTWIEIGETIGIFTLLSAIDAALFLQGTTTVLGIPLVYILLIPLFIIALRLRPRFVTLALVITSAFALAGLIVNGPMIGTPQFGDQLFQLETLLITLASMFFIVVSLEENRRLNSNLMRTQLATLENAVARVSSESEAKNDFIAVLAHELRNPLAPIMSGIDLLKLHPERDADELETLTVMEDRMATVKRLLDDLLDISRISEGKLTLSKKEVELESILKLAILSTTHLFKERHQTFIFRDHHSPLMVYADPVRLEQIFTNLLTNASKYSDSGDQITMCVIPDGGFVKIIVQDTGIGIVKESLEHIFLPFHQVELGARTRKGLGIGLALVHNFVQLHDGSVEAESEGAGKGSVFTVRLPLLQK